MHTPWTVHCYTDDLLLYVSFTISYWGCDENCLLHNNLLCTSYTVHVLQGCQKLYAARVAWAAPILFTTNVCNYSN